MQYGLRLLDVKSGRVLVDSVRERTAGGFLAIMTATYPADLTADVTDGNGLRTIDGLPAAGGLGFYRAVSP